MGSEAAIDLTLRAFADHNRREILRVIRSEPKPVGVISEEVGLSQQTTSHHLQILHKAGLATRSKEGTKHLFLVNTDGLAAVRSYLDDFWPSKLVALKTAIESETRKDHG